MSIVLEEDIDINCSLAYLYYLITDRQIFLDSWESFWSS